MYAKKNWRKFTIFTLKDKIGLLSLKDAELIGQAFSEARK